ncbi:MAG: hypothetical protein K2Q06_06105 [Parvularculaceae bacterium]|nr:hypothetical protein [Parvularculaceae bacterium]
MAALAAFRRELDVFIDETLSIDGRREIFLGVARPTIAAFEADWRAAMGGADVVETFVDGVRGAPLEAVTIPGGVVAARARPVGPVVARLFEMYDLFVKVVTGGYAADIAVFVGDAPASRVQAENAGPGAEVIVTNLSPFARKGEVRGFNDRDGSNFPNGLFEGLAGLLRDEFAGSGATISSRWRTLDGRRLPAIAIS